MRLRTYLILIVALGTTPDSRAAETWRTAEQFPNIGLSKLTVDQKTSVIAAFRKQECPCSCEMKIAQCLIEDDECDTSPRLATKIIAAVRRGNLVSDANDDLLPLRMMNSGGMIQERFDDSADAPSILKHMLGESADDPSILVYSIDDTPTYRCENCERNHRNIEEMS